MALKEIITWLAVSRSKFYAWIKRYGKANEHNELIPRDFWLEPWEREAIVNCAVNNPFEGYRRLTFMLLDQDIVARQPRQRLANSWPGRVAAEMEPEEKPQGNRAAFNNLGTVNQKSRLMYSR